MQLGKLITFNKDEVMRDQCWDPGPCNLILLFLAPSQHEYMVRHPLPLVLLLPCSQMGVSLKMVMSMLPGMQMWLSVILLPCFLWLACFVLNLIQTF